MLKKLIRHEFKAVNRLMIPTHLGLILITIIGRFYVQFAMNNSALFDSGSSAVNIWSNLVNVMLVFFYMIALAAAVIITSIYFILRFRNNLFTDEGYLMHTLPVPASSHIISKLMVFFVWSVADGFLVILSVFTMFVNADFFKAFGDMWVELIVSYPDAFGVPAAVGFPVMIITGIIQTIARILVIYACIAIGHSFNSHKILSSIGIYVGYTIVTNMLSTVFTALFGFASYGNSTSLFIAGMNSGNGTLHFWLSFGFSLILNTVIGIAAYVLTRYFMTKRLNLE